MKHRVLATILTGLCLLHANASPVPAATTGNGPPSDSLLDDGGLTRSSLAGPGQSDLGPLAEPVPVPASVVFATQQSAQKRAFAHHRHRHPPAASSPPRMATRTPRRRNPVVSFVYWWNGWVVRTFHTRTGTVLLDRVGAKA